MKYLLDTPGSYPCFPIWITVLAAAGLNPRRIMRYSVCTTHEDEIVHSPYLLFSAAIWWIRIHCRIS